MENIKAHIGQNTLTGDREFGRKHRLLLMLVFPISFLFFGLIYGTFFEPEHSVITGIYKIIKSPSILLTDFMEVGGIGSAAINVALIAFFNLFFLYKFKMRLNGMLIASYFMVIGFSFFGKNIINILPLYLGGYLYSKYKHIPMKNVFLITMYSTSLAPFISYMALNSFIPRGFAYFVGIITGIFIGFFIIPLSGHMLKFHDGYNLYNIGFTAGLIGMLCTSIFRNFGIEIKSVYFVKESTPIAFTIFLFVQFIFLICMGYYYDKNVFREYTKIFKYHGRAVTDFPSLIGYPITFVNMGLMGIICLIYVSIMHGVFSGPVVASIFSVVGFSAAGKHPVNTVPVVIGTCLGALFFGIDLTSTGFMMSSIFSTALAPISGTYGPVSGAIAGIIHIALVSNVTYLHGGLNLYNNGFSGGLVAGILVPILEALKKEKI